MVYNQMAAAYKSLFPVDHETLRFASDKWKRGKILDLACGNGGYAIELAKQGFEVEGVDLSEAMIEAARKSAAEENVHVVFSVADMADPLPANRYEGVLFIGNSLVHASSIDTHNEDSDKYLSVITTRRNPRHANSQLRPDHETSACHFACHST
jgi:glycine/sarcosine N-methyltransferase